MDLLIWDGTDVPPPGTATSFNIFKGAEFLAELMTILDAIQPAVMVELGVYQGGSAIYWDHLFRCRLSAFDIRPEIAHLTSYLERHDLTHRIHLHLGVSQADRAALGAAIREDFGGDLIDVVIDDGSHMHDDARASLETLLPFVRPGGAYIIEDWSWGHQRLWSPDVWADKKLLSTLLVEPILICAANEGVIERVDVRKNFIVIWRGTTALPTDGTFRLRDAYWPRGFSAQFS